MKITGGASVNRIINLSGDLGLVNTQGSPGKDGYTPIKGVDYFTEADKREFTAEVEDNLKPTLDLKADKAYVDEELVKKADKLDIPTKTSELDNDSNFITSIDIEGKADLSYVDEELGKKADKSEIPSLDGYVKDTDYASATKGGVIKVSSATGTEVTSDGTIRAMGFDKATWATRQNGTIVSKLTLNNILADYIKDNDYASSSKSGVIKILQGYGNFVNNDGVLVGYPHDYAQYKNDSVFTMIAKGTLENVLANYEKKTEYEKIMDVTLTEEASIVSTTLTKEYKDIVVFINRNRNVPLPTFNLYYVVGTNLWFGHSNGGNNSKRSINDRILCDGTFDTILTSYGVANDYFVNSPNILTRTKVSKINSTFEIRGEWNASANFPIGCTFEVYARV